MSTGLPDAVRRAATDVVGDVTGLEVLSGLSGATVLRVTGRSGTVVAKGGVHPRERAFYEHVRLVAVPVPHLLGVVDEERSWLLLEDLPTELPPERWGDAEVTGTLRRLHAHPHDLLDPVPEPFRPSWSEDATRAAVAALALPGPVARRLDAVRRHAQPLFDPVAVVSGDANPRNWRLRGEQAVLLDWERIGLAHPAIDLAVALPGLCSHEEAAAAAATYGGIELEQVLWAKAWSVVEFVSDTGHPGRSAVLDQLRGLAPAWVASLPA